VELFADVLPEKFYRSARKLLRKLRRAAGAARDADVFADMLVEWGRDRDEAVQPGLDFLLGYTHGQRNAAQEQLRAAADHHSERLAETAEQAADAPRPSRAGPRTLGELAEVHLADRLSELGQATAAAHAVPGDYERLHQVRIVGKRLRYAMELFADCFAPAFRKEWYASVEQMQEVLGSANDSHGAASSLTALRRQLRARGASNWPRLAPALDALIRFHQGRLPRERRRFQQWFAAWQALTAAKPLATLRLPATD
jgi:CHAD domain-containing protein